MTFTPFRSKAAKEKRLTTAPGLDDGPDYSPDGKYIYFNSERTGLMQIWRMKPDGSDQEQVTSDDYNNWFAHPSPNGRWIVFLSYAKEVKGHPADQDVMLRLMSLADWKNPGAGQIVWRAGDHQRSVLVAGQPEHCLCQLSNAPSVIVAAKHTSLGSPGNVFYFNRRPESLSGAQAILNVSGRIF